MSIHPSVTVAVRALKRNTLQTSLTVLGMTIGVAAVLTMIALGTGAEAAIEDQVRAAGVHLNVHVRTGAKRWFTRLHGTDLQLPLIRRAWTLRTGRFFGAREQSRSDQVIVLGSIAAEKLFGDMDPVGHDVVMWNQPFHVVGVVTTTSWVVAPTLGDDQFDAVYVPFT